MSLINKMLKDLEYRGEVKSVNPTFDKAVTDNVTAKTKVKEKVNLKFLAISGLLLITYLVGYYWFTQSNQTIAPASNETVVQNTPQHQKIAQVARLDKHAEASTNEVIIAEITAAIESEIQESNGKFNQAQIQAMVIEATKSKVDMSAGELEQVILGRIDLPPVQTQSNHSPKRVKLVKTKKIANPTKQVEMIAKSATILEGQQYQNEVATKQAIAIATPKVVAVAKKQVDQPAPKLAAKSKVPSTNDSVVVTEVKAPTNIIKDAPKKTLAVAKVKKPKRKPTTIAKPLGKAHFVKQTNPSQKSEHLYQAAISLVQKGRVTEAQNILAQALKAYPGNQDARQTLAALLLDNNRVSEAKTVLSQGLVINPDHTQFRMAVARLEVELGNRAGALNTLLAGANQATDNAKYQAFLATMLQRENRHEEAVQHFHYALGIDRGMTKAFVGLGMSLQELNRFEEAQVAYNNAQNDRDMNANLKSFLDVRIKEVNHRISSR